MTIKLLFIIVLISLMSIVNAQDKNLSAKFNFGTSFSKPGGDLGEVATKGRALQPSFSAEAVYFIEFSPKTHFGITTMKRMIEFKTGGIDYISKAKLLKDQKQNLNNYI